MITLYCTLPLRTLGPSSIYANELHHAVRGDNHSRANTCMHALFPLPGTVTAFLALVALFFFCFFSFLQTSIYLHTVLD